MALYKGKEVQYVSSPPHISGICNTANTVMPKCRRPSSGSSLFVDESSADLVFSSSSTMGAATGNFSSLCGALNDNDPDELECGSEDGLEALAEEMNTSTNLAISNPRRNPSKRSRAAEVHNLSEKRRRSRINEKMKALQNLIPNSNKTDKASMLDDAIEYLKQLQLQVQLLSMRNGISLHPNQPSNSNLSNMMNSESCFGLQSSTHSHLGSFQLHPISEVINREAKLLHHQPNINFGDTTNPLASK